MPLIRQKDASGRPIFLNLLQIKLPLCALVSICHRISGLYIILSMPVVTWVLYMLTDERMHTALIQWLDTPWASMFMFTVKAAYLYHLLAGFRHIILDFSYDHSLVTARYSAGSLLVLYTLCLVLISLRTLEVIT